MSNEVVLYEKKDSGVALVSLNRPDRLNAITGELTARLKEKIDDACKDDDVKVIVPVSYTHLTLPTILRV